MGVVVQQPLVVAKVVSCLWPRSKDGGGRPQRCCLDAAGDEDNTIIAVTVEALADGGVLELRWHLDPW